jgi:hypothetical protein
MMGKSYEVEITIAGADNAPASEHLELASPSETPAEAAKAVRDYLRHANRADIGTFKDVSADD